MEELKDIEPYAYEVIYLDGDGELFYMQHLAKERAVEVEGLVRGLHTPKQMQEFAISFAAFALKEGEPIDLVTSEDYQKHAEELFKKFEEKQDEEV